MKRITYLMICAMLMIGAFTTVWAQSHRHTERNDSTEKVILSESGDGVINTDDTSYVGYDDDNWEERHYDRPGILVRQSRHEDGILLAILAITGVFFGPVILVAVILYFIYKRKKQRDQVVIAAINAGQPIPSGYGPDPREDAAVGKYEGNKQEYSGDKRKNMEKSMMEKGVTQLSIGIGLIALSYFLMGSLLTGIGIFVAILGLGKIVIAYMSEKKR